MRQYGCGQRGLCPEIQVVDLNYPNRPKSVGDSIIRFRGTG
jgi:hypothetical protein